MPSAIDVTKPVYGNPTTQSVRDNFTFAHDEISQLQADIINRVIKTGDAMLGDLTLFRDPQLSMHATNMNWVINQIRSTANACIYIGDYNASTDRVLTSGQASVPVNQPLPPAGGSNTQMYLTVKVGTVTSIGNQPPGGVPAGSWLLSNGTSWNVWQPSAAGVTAQSIPVNPPITNLPGSNVYDALSAVPANYLLLTGGTVTGPITLTQAPTLSGHAATKGYVDNLSSSVAVSDTPPSNPKNGGLWWDSSVGQLNISYQDADSQQWVIANSTSGWVDAPGDGVAYARRNAAWTSVDAMLAPRDNNVGRNLLHNGKFNIAQRGNGNWTTNGYTLDRWYVASVSDTIQFLRVSTTGQSFGGDEEVNYFLVNNFTGNAAAGAYNTIQQPIEYVRKLAGKTITLSFWAACTSGTLKLGINYMQSFGNGGSPSPQSWNANGQSVTITTTWTRYTITTNIPSIVGKTLGTNGGDFTALAIAYSSGSTNSALFGNIGVQSGSVYLWGMQLEIGNVMTPLEKVDINIEWANCQRFYLVGQAYAGGYSSGNVTAIATVSFPVPMRAQPSLVITSNNDIAITSPGSASIIGGFAFTGVTPAGATGWAINRSFTLTADL